MPLTFLAHQAPALVIKKRWPAAFDGVGLIVGTAIPDAWYITSGWLYGPAGIPLWMDGHQTSNLVTTAVLPGTVLTMAVRRYVLTDTWAPRWWVSAYSVAVGALTHLAIDQLTHWRIGGAPVGQAVSSALLVCASLWMLANWWPRWTKRFRRLDPSTIPIVIVSSVIGIVWGISRTEDHWIARLFTAVNVGCLGWIAATALSRRRSISHPV